MTLCATLISRSVSDRVLRSLNTCAVYFATRQYQRQVLTHTRNTETVVRKCTRTALGASQDIGREELAATLRWFTAGGAIRIALRQLLQNRKLRHL